MGHSIVRKLTVPTVPLSHHNAPTPPNSLIYHMILRLGTFVTVKNTCTTPSRTLEQNKLKRMAAIATAAAAIGVNIRTVRVSCGWKNNLAKSYPQATANQKIFVPLQLENNIIVINEKDIKTEI